MADDRNPPAPGDFSLARDDPRRDFDPADYVCRSLIGSGAMGDVIEALDVRLRRIVAIKRFKAVALDPVDLERARERMRLEGEVLAKMGHPALLGIYAASVTRGGCPFLVTERLHGRTLGSELKERKFLPVADAISITCTVLAGLGHVHPTIVHRDIKPDNIFLTDAPAGGVRGVKVLDFGLAKVIDASHDPNSPSPLAIATATGTALGSPRFMSPEQCTGDKAIDHRADIYGIGATLYVMLTGRAPFDHYKQIHLLMRAHVDEPCQPPSVHGTQAIPPDLDRALLKALAKDPQDRFQSAREFATELLRIAAAERGSREPRPPAPTTLKGTMMIADNSAAIQSVRQPLQASMVATPPLPPASMREPPRLAPTAPMAQPPMPQQQLPSPQASSPQALSPQLMTSQSGSQQMTRPSDSPTLDATFINATLVSRANANAGAAKQRRALIAIGVVTVLCLAVLATIAILALQR